MPPCRSCWIRVSAKCRILAARGLHLAVKLSVLLSISLVFLLACSSGTSSDLTDADRMAITKKACRVLQGVNYSYSTFEDMVWLYTEYYPEQRAIHESGIYSNISGNIRIGRDRPEFRDKEVVSAAAAINARYPGILNMRSFCDRLYAF